MVKRKDKEKEFEVIIKSSPISLEEKRALMRKWISSILFCANLASEKRNEKTSLWHNSQKN